MALNVEIPPSDLTQILRSVCGAMMGWKQADASHPGLPAKTG